MKTTQSQQQAQTPQPAARLLGRQLARELTKEEIEAISGGLMKAPTHDSGGGTGSGLWGGLDD
jgi:hypothetical protein